jgi:hypothetical protein
MRPENKPHVFYEQIDKPKVPLVWTLTTQKVAKTDKKPYRSKLAKSIYCVRARNESRCIIIKHMFWTPRVSLYDVFIIPDKKCP